MTNDGKRGDHNATRGDWCSTGLRDLYRDLDTDDNGITRPGLDRVQVQHTDAGDSFAPDRFSDSESTGWMPWRSHRSGGR